MFARCLSLVMIAVVVACPMWCGSGLCCADQCGSKEQSSHQACPRHGSAGCCCEEPSPDNGDQSPCQCPNTKSCQGVCGGAVFEKPIELNDESGSVFSPLDDTEIFFATQLAECRSLDVEHPWERHGGNLGRFLRTLHMSSLC